MQSTPSCETPWLAGHWVHSNNNPPVPGLLNEALKPELHTQLWLEPKEFIGQSLQVKVDPSKYWEDKHDSIEGMKYWPLDGENNKIEIKYIAKTSEIK